MPTGYPPATITPHAIAVTNRFMIGRPLSIDASGRIRLAQKETTNLAIFDYQSDESVIAAVFEFELPQVDLVAPLIQPSQESCEIALTQARRKLRAKTVEHRLRHGRLERSVAAGDEIWQRLRLRCGKHILHRRLDLRRCLDLRCLRPGHRSRCAEEEHDADKSAVECGRRKGVA